MTLEGRGQICTENRTLGVISVEVTFLTLETR